MGSGKSVLALEVDLRRRRVVAARFFDLEVVGGPIFPNPEPRTPNPLPLATVRLVNAVFYAHHGVMEEEHRIGGRYEVDVAITLDVTEAAEADDLSKTVDYEKVYSLVRDVVTGSSAYLIESVGWRIATAVGEAYPTVALVEVTVRKPNPPVGGPCDRAEVVVRWAPE